MSETRSSDDARDAAARPSMVEPRGKKARAGQPTMTVRARRRREEAVRRLVADVQSKADSTIDQAAAAEAHDWLVASTVATALEKGLDRDLHAELVQEAKDNAGRIGQVCHDHADVFLASVAQVAALAGPTADLADGLKDAEQEMLSNTAGPMHQAARQWQDARRSHARARTLNVMVDACQGVALQLERARKQAALGRPRAALDAVDQARTALTIPVESLFQGKDERLWKETLSSEEQKVDDMHQKKLSNLEQTPFGKRATVVLPKIENEVLMSAKRGLNKWFLALRSGGEGAKVGRAVLRQCAHSLAAGPGLLGLGGTLPPAYVWRAKMADNLISRVGQSSKVARAARQGYWFDRDAPREADRLETVCPREGTERYAEAVAFAFGWYRCWEDGSTQLVDPSEFAAESIDTSGRGDGLRGSRHGLRGSRHGRGRSLGFRAKTSSRSQTYEEISSTLGASGLRVSNQASQWAELLIPSVLYSISPTRREEDEMLRGIAESVHPVRRAEVAYGLLGKTEEFVQYYEQNRFGEMTIGGDGNDDLGERKSSLSWLTGDDISIGTDRIFFAKTLPNALIPSVVGYSAVESALELSNFADEEESDKDANGPVRGTTGTVGASLNASRFRDSSERYERALVTELGHLIRARALRANLGELVRSSNLLVAFRAALKIVHPSSTARRADKDLLALDTDMLTTALRIAQDEQLKATMAIVMDDQKVPMLVSEVSSSSSGQKSGGAGVPDPEEVGLPFGLSQMKQKPQKSEIEFQEQSRTSYNQAPLDECFTFSHSVPVILRSIHARAITCAAFALSQQELGQKFPETKKVGGPAGYVFDCVEECINAAVIGMKDSDNIIAEGSVEKAVQVMANVVALQSALPRLFGTLIRGMFHIGLVPADEVEHTFRSAEKTVKAAEKACDAQVGSTYSLVYEICRTKIDSHLNYALENFNWVAKSTREAPNPYCEGLIGFLKSVFSSLGPMDDGSRAGLHFSCLGHISERLVTLLSKKPGDHADEGTIAPISRIDAFGIKNLLTDCEEFERFADSAGIPQLRDCFSELRVLCTFMLDKELPALVLPDNAGARRRKYTILSLEKVGNILEKYVGTGMFTGGTKKEDMLFLEKKEVQQLIKIIRAQS